MTTSMAKIEVSNAVSIRMHVMRGVLLSAIAILAAACGSGDPGADKVTLGTGQGQAADPVTVDFPIFYVKRPLPPVTPQTQPSNVLRNQVFDAGADLYMRASASPSAAETNLTGSTTNSLGDVRDVDVSFDGKKVVFAMRSPKKANTQDKKQPGWSIWEYDIPSSVLRALTDNPASNVTPAFNDRFPHYLPDGRIVFSSTRQRQSRAILLDEGKTGFSAQDENNQEHAYVLHVMDKDGGNIRQISFNQSHDLDSAVLPSGQIVFSRWDGAGATDHVDLYRINPDGSGLELLYGKQDASHAIGATRPPVPPATLNNNNVVQFTSPRPLLNGQILTLVRPFSGAGIDDASDIIQIDANNYVENTQPTLPNVGVMTGPAFNRVPSTVVYTDPGYSPGGRYRSAFPLPDGSNRLLVSWTLCRLLNTDGTRIPCTDQNLAITPALLPAPPLFAVYIYDLTQGTQLPIVLPQEDFIYDNVVAGASRALPPVILDRVGGADYPASLDAQAVGVIDIKSVYDVDGVDTAPGGILAVRNPKTATAAQRPARFLRIEKAVSLPDKDTRDIKNTSFGPTGRFMREIIGYAPIEPDGSVRVKVPANVAIQLTVVDTNARRISPLHRNWLQVQAGELLTCNGCHAATSPPPPALPKSHGRSNLFASVNPGAPANGLFANTDSTLQGNPGETMAQTRANWMCKLANGMSACNPSVDVIFDDLWTDPTAAGHAKDTSVDYCYSAALTDVLSSAADTTIKHTCLTKLNTLAPAPNSCETNWSSICRIVINYIDHLQPLWDVDRIPAGSTTVNDKCTGCHSPTDAAGKPRVPAGQLDMSNTASDAQPDHFTSYEKLLNNHNAQELNATMTALQDVCLQKDPQTGVCIQFQVVSGSMAALNARGSRFFTAVNAASHAGFLTTAEQRLISEWLDIGAQYYNNPFLAPVN